MQVDQPSVKSSVKSSASGRVVVAMSGGVDSSVAAALLARQGHELIGVSLRFWTCEDRADGQRRSCCGVDGVAAARATAGRLGIPHYVVDCRQEFEERVLRPAWNDYAQGRTPNPCVLCNAAIKFGHLLELARGRFGAAWLATGHHARVTPRVTGEAAPALLRGADPDKDQSYFLFALDAEQLAGTLFPVGALTKREVREIARELGLPGAERAESQDACLATDDGQGFAEALRRRFEAAPRPGRIVGADGATLGVHDGIHRFTVGQRKGLGVALGRPAYVVALDHARAEVVLSDDRERLLAGGLVAAAPRWLVPPEQVPGWDGVSLTAGVQIRYRQRPVRARITPGGAGEGTVVVRFARPQRAVTPGQAAVFYLDQGRVIGGGWIERTTDEGAP